MKLIRIGNSPAGSGVNLDVERLIESRLLVQANSGGGKSWLLRRLLEQTHAVVQQLILDIEGEFHTLREKFDYALVAKTGGDVAADPRIAAQLARRLFELGISAIIDLQELKKHERTQFVKSFLEGLIESPRAIWHPVLVVVDEAHQFCPEKDKCESTGAVIDLMTRGRKRGICGILATQRLSKLNKDAAAEANVKLIGRASLDVDMKRAAEELGFTSGEDRARLRTLPAGDFFAFGPGISVAVLQVHVGEVQTTHPRPGQRAAPVPPAREKVRKALEQLADLPKEVEAQHKSLADLKAENVSLKRQLASKPAAVALPPPKEVRVEVSVVPVDVKNRISAAIGFLEGLERACRGERLAFESTEEKFKEAMPHVKRAPIQSLTPARRAIAPPQSSVDGEPLTGPEQRILDAIAWLESIGNAEPEETAVAFLAGYTIGGGAFNNPKGRLRGRGLIEYRGDRVLLTEVGRAVAQVPEQPLTTEEMHRRVLERLPGPEAKLLRALIDVHPQEMTNEALANATGYSAGGGAFNNPRGRLRSLGLVEYVGKQVRARDILFVNGGGQ